MWSPPSDYQSSNPASTAFWTRIAGLSHFLYNGDKNKTYSRWLLWGLNKMVFASPEKRAWLSPTLDIIYYCPTFLQGTEPKRKHHSISQKMQSFWGLQDVDSLLGNVIDFLISIYPSLAIFANYNLRGFVHRVNTCHMYLWQSLFQMLVLMQWAKHKNSCSHEASILAEVFKQ